MANVDSMEVDEKEKARIDDMHEKLEQGKVRCPWTHVRPPSHCRRPPERRARCRAR